MYMGNNRDENKKSFPGGSTFKSEDYPKGQFIIYTHSLENNREINGYTLILKITDNHKEIEKKEANTRTLEEMK